MWTLSSVLLVSGLEVPHCHHMCEDVHTAPYKKLTNHSMHNTRGEQLSLLVEVGGGSLWLVAHIFLAVEVKTRKLHCLS
jgi:hypothetical protein